MKNAKLSLLACLLFVGSTTAKADMNWDGDGTSGYFSWWNNWYGNNFPTTGFGSGNLNFNFQNTGISTGLVNDVGWKDIDNIYWNSTYGAAMTLSGATGNGIAFKQKLENLSNFTQTVTMDLSGGKSGATAIELNPVNGNLTMSGNLYNDFSNDYLVYGTTGKTLTLNTTLGVGATAANVDFSVKQASNVQVNSNQTYGGTTAVEAGSFKTGASVTLASSGIVVSGGTFETTSADVVVNTGTVNLSAGEYKLGGNDTVASLTVSGGLLSTANSSTLTAATYALSGGTVSANLGAGTATVATGTTALNGTLGATTVNVNSGTMNIGSADRLANAAAVTVAGGTLGMSTFSDTVGSFTISSGTLGGSGTLTASTYALNGGTVSANLGAGTATASSGTTSLSGTSAATVVNVSGGLLTLASANRLADTAAVAVSSGELAMGGNDTIGSLSTTGGTVSGTGTLTAATYALNGGTVSANLGAGTATASSGTTSLSGTSAATVVNVSGGLLNLASANRLADTAAVAVSSGTLGVGGNDTIGSLSTTGGTVSGTGTLTAATYALNGGTVSVNLGAGTVNTSSGTTLLSGTSGAANVNVSGGLLSLASVNRLADTAAVAVSSGELAMSGSDTIGSLSTTGGTVSGTGTLTAATYALNGGTVSANLGAGTATASSGTTSLSGTSAATVVNVTGGLLSLVSANRLADAAAVTVSSGELAMGGDDIIGSLSTTGGTVSGTGTLTAATYALNGGTVSVNLGAGTVNASSGTTSLSGTSAAANVNVQGGTLNTSSANRLADGASVAVSSGTLGVGGNDTVGSLAASGTGVVTMASGRTLTANGNSSITGSARATGGTVAIANNSLMNLANSSTTTTSDLSIGSGSTLAGTGGTSGQIKGSGLLSPGNSPGILTSGSVDLTGGIDFAFEFTAPGAPTYSLAGNSKNDLLHLTSGSAPFSGSFSTGNTVSFYFNDAGLSASLTSVTPTTYLGGFFVDTQNFNIAGLLSNATKQYFVAATGGSTSFNGVSYNLMSDEVASRIILSNVNQSGADFTTGTVNGTVLGVMAVPEPSSGSLLLAGIGSLIVLRRFRKKA